MMNKPPPASSRARVLIPLFLGLLALVVVVHLIIGLPEFLLYGLVGGLIFCVLIVGRDTLLAAQRNVEKRDEDRRRDAERAANHREDNEQ